VALLAAAALALGACGGDDGGNGSGTTDAGSPDFTTNSGTGTTGTTERERTGTTEDRTTKTSESRNDSGGSGGGSGRGNGGGSGKGGSGTNDSGSAAQPNPQPGNVAKIAEKVCNSFLPKQISRDLENDKTKPEDVARDYSRGFPEKQRERAYEGCLAGLKKR
jgi:hypothetical protein